MNVWEKTYQINFLRAIYTSRDIMVKIETAERVVWIWDTSPPQFIKTSCANGHREDADEVMELSGGGIV